MQIKITVEFQRPLGLPRKLEVFADEASAKDGGGIVALLVHLMEHDEAEEMISAERN